MVGVGVSARHSAHLGRPELKTRTWFSQRILGSARRSTQGRNVPCSLSREVRRCRGTPVLHPDGRNTVYRGLIVAATPPPRRRSLTWARARRTSRPSRVRT